MATLSTRLRNKKRQDMMNRQFEAREKLRAASLDSSLSDEDRLKARMTLQKLPRNGARSRVRNRCSLTGRPRGVYRKFGLCRNKFRELALLGQIPGVTKASW